MILDRYILHKRQNILKLNKSKQSTMTGTFNTTFVIKWKLKLLVINQTAEVDAKCHLKEKLLSNDLNLSRNLIYKLSMIFNFKDKTITWQEVSMSMKPPNITSK